MHYGCQWLHFNLKVVCNSKSLGQAFSKYESKRLERFMCLNRGLLIYFVIYHMTVIHDSNFQSFCLKDLCTITIFKL
jgi:hypothetical protein